VMSRRFRDPHPTARTHRGSPFSRRVDLLLRALRLSLEIASSARFLTEIVCILFFSVAALSSPSVAPVPRPLVHTIQERTSPSFPRYFPKAAQPPPSSAYRRTRRFSCLEKFSPSLLFWNFSFPSRFLRIMGVNPSSDFLSEGEVEDFSLPPLSNCSFLPFH